MLRGFELDQAFARTLAPRAFPCLVFACVVMAPHLTSTELDWLKELEGKGLAPTEVRAKLEVRRTKSGLATPHLTKVRLALKGKTYRRGQTETRGRPSSLTTLQLRRLNTVRKALIKEAKGEFEIHWDDVLAKAKLDVDPATARRHLKKAGFDLRWRRPREKPTRSVQVEKERLEICQRWRRLPLGHWSEKVDMIIDNKMWPVPTHTAARTYAKMRKVRGHLRTRGEGLKKHFTKPGDRTHRVNPGARVLVCAGICKNKVKVWHYLPKGRWSGQAAADVYAGPIHKVLKRTFPGKTSYRILEDNDPTGYKSVKGKEMKASKKIGTLDLPRYSPDLNPCDYFLWDEIQRRMSQGEPDCPESAAKYKARLRKVAMGIPATVIRRGVQAMKRRCQAVFDAKGGNIACD